MSDIHDDEADVCTTDISDIKPSDKPVLRDANGKFLPGTARGPGRPHGAKSQFNKQVIDSLQSLWEKDGAEMLEILARDKPEVIMGMVSRMIPQALAAEAITGEAEKVEGNQDITIRLVQQVAEEPALPAREVEGELLPHEDSVH